jgi:flagellar hook protein FlgE
MPFDSIFTGISGVDAYQAQIDQISNNIANVGTTGFKGQETTFQDLIYQTQRGAQAPQTTTGGVDAQQLGFGVQVAGVSTVFTQGGLETTGVSTNLAINGDGFFVLKNTDGSGATSYTRDGAFQINQNGLLYDPTSGLAVQGYTANSTGGITTGSPGNLTIPLGLKSKAVGTGLGTKTGPTGDTNFDVQLGGNLDQSAYITSATAVVAPATVSTTIYDSLGNAHLATISYIPVAPTTTSASVSTGPNQYTVTQTSTNALPVFVDNASGVSVQPASRYEIQVTFNDGTQFGGTTAATPGLASTSVDIGYAFFDNNGAFINTTSLAAGNLASASTVTTTTVVDTTTNPPTVTPTTTTGTTNGTAYQAPYGIYASSDPATKSVGFAGVVGAHAQGVVPGTENGGQGYGDIINIAAFSNPNGQVPNQVTNNAQPVKIALDLSQVTALSGSPNATVVSQNGYAQGTLQNVTVGQNGTITGSFSNGQSTTLGQVALATFQNEQGLVRDGGSLFSASADSGSVQYGIAGQGKLGAIVSGSLEESNVSLADEFTKLIVAQNAFSANSKSITTANENFQTIEQIIR